MVVKATRLSCNGTLISSQIKISCASLPSFPSMPQSPGHAPQPIVSRHVAVIGAGAAGLVTARELRREGHSVVVFERGDQVGGLWVYTPNVESDQIGLDPTRTTVHSSVYHSLRTNLPRDSMGFSDYPFVAKDDPDRDPRLFPGHREVMMYLQDFAREFGIDELVRFETEVVRVRFVEEEEKWKIKSKQRHKEVDEIFDAVVVCNGHYTQPLVSHVPGINKWPGKQMHSHNYRDPKPFQDQVVVLIGNSASAFDISRELAGVAKEVHIAARTVKYETFGKQPAYDNLWLHPMIKNVCEDGSVHFQDGSFVIANIIIHCTGYKYHFPFLETNGFVIVDDNRVGPLYKHIFPPALAPWLSFVGIPFQVITFPMFELQSKWIAGVLSNRITLPSQEEMMEDVKALYSSLEASGIPKRDTHALDDKQVKYNNWLAGQCGCPAYEDWRMEMYYATVKGRLAHLESYRDEWETQHLVLQAYEDFIKPASNQIKISCASLAGFPSMLRSPGHAPQPIVSRHVAVIGAGAAGLVTARELRREGHSVVVFERGDQVGGTWVYTPNVESDPIGLEPTRTTVHSSLYDSLRTNIPREAMGFRDYPFVPKDDPGRDPRRFPGHREVLMYLQDFTREFRIDELVRFETEVVRVRLVEEEEKWKIKSKQRSGKEMGLELDEIFDAVVVCNGHFTEPRVAYIPGINEWSGKQMHSHNYRDPEPFRDQVVVLIGNSVSAFDISWEVAGVAKEIHIAARTVIDGTFGKQPAYDNMWLHPMIKDVCEDGSVNFLDGSIVIADIILHCTGYKYHFPFLETNGIVTVDDNRVGPLYKHIFPPALAPRLSFVGLPWKAIPFPMFELQSKWIGGVLSNRFMLPSQEEMMGDVEAFYSSLETFGTPKRYTHCLGDNLVEYNNWLASQCRCPAFEDWRMQMFLVTIKSKLAHLESYREEWEAQHLVLQAYEDFIKHTSEQVS